MLRVGVHVSISGGFDKSIDREIEIGGNCGQIFSHSPRSWGFDVPDDGEAEKFKERYEESRVSPLVIHESYLPNLATPKSDLYNKSFKATEKEVKVAKKLGLEYINIHPGTHTGFGEENGLNKIIDSLNELNTDDEVTILLETTSGSGTTLGYDFSQIGMIIDNTEIKTGVTLDTCHSYAAGYDFSTKEGLDDVLDDFDEDIGLEHLELIHLNDSAHEVGSKKDKHEHIGLGKIGEDAFRRLINDDRLRDIPFVLETPVDSRRGDKENIEKVKELRE